MEPTCIHAGRSSFAIGETTGGVEILAKATIKEVDGEVVEGKEAAPKLRRFAMTAYNGGPMMVAGWNTPVVVDLAGMNVGNNSRPILIDHINALDHLLGQTDRIEKIDGSLFVEGRVHAKSERAKQVVELNDDGFQFQASIGARVTKREFIPAGQRAKANGQTFEGPIVIARESVLGEVSFVTLGADDTTSARIAAAAAKEAPMNFEQWLEAKGFKLADLSDVQKSSLEAAFNAEKGSAVTASAPTDDVSTLLANAKKRQEGQKKIADITAKALQDSPDQIQIIEAMSKQAAAGDWDSNKYELELLRATRPQAQFNIISRKDEDLSNSVVEAALCLNGGLQEPEKAFNEKTLEAASRRWQSGLGLGELLMLFARRSGSEALSTRNVGPLLQAAFSDGNIRASAISNLSLPGILANTANKFLREGFYAVESVWREIAAKRSVNDFKQISSYSLTGDFTYTEIPAGGKIEHGQVGELAYNNQAKSYGRMFGIDRRDIINDDIGALTTIPRRLGRGGALKLNAVFWTTFLNNGSFFTSGRNNYFDGATAGVTTDSRLNIDGLTRASTAFMNQTDPDGMPIAVAPKYLVVPNALAIPAKVLMNSTEIRDTTASTKLGVANPFANAFTVIASAYLSNANLTGYSTTGWYLLADPNDMPVIEVAFLNGVETPTVETADADFNSLGIQMRGYHDFGVALQEYRGGVKMKGAAA